MDFPAGIKSISAGSYHAAIITLDSQLLTWGWNSFGQLVRISSHTNLFQGDGTQQLKNFPTPINQTFDAVYAGWAHTVAIKNNILYTTGANFYG